MRSQVCFVLDFVAADTSHTLMQQLTTCFLLYNSCSVFHSVKHWQLCSIRQLFDKPACALQFFHSGCLIDFGPADLPERPTVDQPLLPGEVWVKQVCLLHQHQHSCFALHTQRTDLLYAGHYYTYVHVLLVFVHPNPAVHVPIGDK